MALFLCEMNIFKFVRISLFNSLDFAANAAKFVFTHEKKIKFIFTQYPSYDDHFHRETARKKGIFSEKLHLFLAVLPRNTQFTVLPFSPRRPEVRIFFSQCRSRL